MRTAKSLSLDFLILMSKQLTPNTGEKIQILPPEEARKIAAGEVIDRPSALIREFLDNAIDAGSRSIEAIIEEGGIQKTEVIDDGSGMGKADLELCCLTHATSKIRSLDDLQNAVTLGFRGEALAAAAAVSHLEILSSRDGTEAWKLTAGPGKKNPPLLEQSLRTKGTSVRAFGLYDTIPARKRFLKRSGSEAAACRQIFNEKALAFPDRSFRFIQDGILKEFLPPESSYMERFARIFLDEQERKFLHQIAAGGSGFSVSIVAGGPELNRRDRRLQFIFANSRRIQDYALLQAFEYGLQGWFPNGTHPLGAVFISIDPSLADFNIHPAKREARFADPGAIHHAISTALKDFCRRANIAIYLKKEALPEIIQTEMQQACVTQTNFMQTDGSPRGAMHAADSPAFYTQHEKNLQTMEDESSQGQPGNVSLYEMAFHDSSHGASNLAEEAASYGAPQISGEARYLGCLFGLFILVEKGDRLYIIDQHAAHERILYDSFIQGRIAKQELLVPIPFRTESPSDDRFLDDEKEKLAELGIALKREGDEWLIEALPAGWNLSDSETVAEITNLKNSGENLAEHWAATLSCRKAVKDGDFLDEKNALDLAKAAFALPVRLCPHGRPIWYEISRDTLMKAVKRG